MENRREFLQGAVALSLAPMITAGGRDSAATGSIALHCVIVDGRHAESYAFAQEARRLGTPTRVTDGDVTRVWYEELDLLWRGQPRAIAGLTAHGPLFCLERWASDRGMRVVLRVDHRRLPDRSLRHRVAAANAPGLLQRRLDAAGGTYPVAAARAVQQCALPTCQLSSPHGLGCVAGEPEPLITWLIAPPRRV